MTTIPKFLLDKPTPQIKQRLYNGRKIMVWEGRVKVSSVKGWIDNPRIELSKKKFVDKFGERALTQDEIFDLMKNEPEVKLKELREDIVRNGLREPLTLSFEGKLLDGNRRYFAIKYALEAMPVTDPNRQDLETVDTFVLSEDATDEDEQNVLVEENFSPSLKIEWPDYVKATKVVEAHEDGLSIEEIARKFSWNKSKIRETLRINEVISEFIAFATAEKDLEDEDGGGLGLSEQEAETIAAKNYQFFNEAQKSFFEQLKTEIDFKFQFFRWIYIGKFASFPEVRVAHNVWNDAEAKAVLMQPDPTAAKSAKAILDYNSRIIRSPSESIGRIDMFIKFLNELSASDIKSLPLETHNRLRDALELVVRMRNSVIDE
jgi:hypothetical protein